MKFYSTRDTKRACGCSLREAAMMGLAPDGGLFVPERIPQADMAEVERLAGESYAAMAGYLAGLFFGDDFRPAAPAAGAGVAVRFPRAPAGWWGADATRWSCSTVLPAPSRISAPGSWGVRSACWGAAGERLVILTATSGDTGSAVAHGFYGVPGVDVVVLYPEGKISRLQECQMTALGGNIHPLRVAGTFDDCQRLVKELFADAEFRKRRRVTSAIRSTSCGGFPRHFITSTAIAGGGRLRAATVRSSSCRAATTAIWPRGCWRSAWDCPSGGFVAASNINDVVPEFLRTGVYRPRPSVRTPANAMDVGAPSNFERMLWLCGGDPGGPARRAGGIPLRRRLHPPHDRRAVRASRLFLRSPQCRRICGFDGRR